MHFRISLSSFKKTTWNFHCFHVGSIIFRGDYYGENPNNFEFSIHEHGICLYLFNINNLIYADDTTLMAESEEELKSLLMKVKEESKIVGLKLKISEN